MDADSTKGEANKDDCLLTGMQFYEATTRVPWVKFLSTGSISYKCFSMGKYFWKAFFQKLCFLKLFSLLEGFILEALHPSRLFIVKVLRLERDLKVS